MTLVDHTRKPDRPLPLSVEAIDELLTHLVARWHEVEPAHDELGFCGRICDLHRFNFLLCITNSAYVLNPSPAFLCSESASKDPELSYAETEHYKSKLYSSKQSIFHFLHPRGFFFPLFLPFLESLRLASENITWSAVRFVVKMSFNIEEHIGRGFENGFQT